MNPYKKSYILDQQWAILLLLSALSVFFFIGLGSVHLFDWDEINFAESAREMLETGNYSLVQINYQPFWEKPPLFFWLQAASMHIFGVNEFAARFPNAIAGFVYLMTIYFIGKKLKDKTLGLLWALLFFGSLLPHLYFKSGIIDPVFNYFIFLSIYFTARSFEATDRTWPYAFWAGLASGLAIITKGPVGFLLLVLTVLAVTVLRMLTDEPGYSLKKGIANIKSGRFFLPPFLHFGVFALGMMLVVAIWLSAEIYYHGTDIIIKFIEYQIELFNSPVAGHGQPFYYHFVVVFFGCFPASIFVIPALIKEQIDLPLRFNRWMIGLFWVVMILFSLSTTKIVHYSSMTYLPITFLAATYFYKHIEKAQEMKTWLKWLYLLIGIWWALLLSFLFYVVNHIDLVARFVKDEFAIACMNTTIEWTGYEPAIAVLFVAGFLTSYVFFYRKKYLNGLLSISSTIGFTLLLTLLLVIPGIERMTQGTAINFYKSIRHEEAYVETIGFKSYAQYFYSRVKPAQSSQRTDLHWLKYGNIDKKVYFVTQVTNTELDSIGGITKIGSDGGYSFYVRQESK